MNVRLRRNEAEAGGDALRSSGRYNHDTRVTRQIFTPRCWRQASDIPADPASAKREYARVKNVPFN